MASPSPPARRKRRPRAIAEPPDRTSHGRQASLRSLGPDQGEPPPARRRAGALRERSLARLHVLGGLFAGMFAQSQANAAVPVPDARGAGTIAAFPPFAFPLPIAIHP